jgi:hypothetical protein
LDIIGDGVLAFLSNDVFIGRRFGVEEPPFRLPTVPYLALGVRDAEVLGLWKE